jgi:glutathione S-transferase
VRKVMVAVHELGVADRISTVRTVVAMDKVAPELLPDNPLGKIPTLVLEDGTILYDSAVIIEYLDSLVGGGRMIPAGGAARFLELRRHALAIGFLDLLILWRAERAKEAPPAALLERLHEPMLALHACVISMKLGSTAKSSPTAAWEQAATSPKPSCAVPMPS